SYFVTEKSSLITKLNTYRQNAYDKSILKVNIVASGCFLISPSPKSVWTYPLGFNTNSLAFNI
ncbi:MAG: hypothetical protein WBP64_18395, partial [Nitrososphaeraceae archaeon]